MIKICSECGLEFESKSTRAKYCGRPHYRPCPVCGKPVFVKPNTFGDPPRACSTSCMQARKLQTCMEVYGCADPGNRPEAVEKRRRTSLDRYGVDNPSKSQEIKERIVSTFEERYGVKNAGQLEATRLATTEFWENLSDEGLQLINSRRRATCIERYGVDNPRKSEVVKQKTKDTLMQTYGVDCSLWIPEARAKANATILARYGSLNFPASQVVKDKIAKTCMERYGAPYYFCTQEFHDRCKTLCREKYGYDNFGSVPELIERRKATNLEKYGVAGAFLLPEAIEKNRQALLANPRTRISKINLQYKALLESCGFSVDVEVPMGGRWYDLVIPELRLAIEIDPTYTHSSHPTKLNPDGLDDDYHVMKSKVAAKNGYSCVHVFDRDDPDKIAHLVCSVYGAHSSSTFEIGYIDVERSLPFFETYSLSSTYKRAEVVVGVVVDSVLVGACAFGRCTLSAKYQWELLAFHVMPDVEFQAAAAAMIQTFVDDIAPDSLVWYADLAKYPKGLLDCVGFKLSHIVQPSKIWCKERRWFTDSLVSARGAAALLRLEDEDGTDEELLLKHWWLPVYDCGQAVYEWVK